MRVYRIIQPNPPTAGHQDSWMGKETEAVGQHPDLGQAASPSGPSRAWG